MSLALVLSTDVEAAFDAEMSAASLPPYAGIVMYGR
jgi:hypothetical protein